MQTYRVSHRASGKRYYVLADSEHHAVERVTLHLGDAEGRDAWTAEADAPRSGLSKGVVLDETGTPIRTLEA